MFGPCWAQRRSEKLVSTSGTCSGGTDGERASPLLSSPQVVHLHHCFVSEKLPPNSTVMGTVGTLGLGQEI